MKPFLIPILLLVGCTDFNQNHADDYAQRMANVLEFDVSVVNVFDHSFPSASELTISSTQSELSVREFMSIRQCQLHTIIANRNSQIGKIAPSSQVLFNDLEILHHGPACLNQLRENKQGQLASKLESFLKSKKLGIDRSLWQAILGSKENSKFWLASNHVENYPRQLLIDPLNDIQELIKLVKDVQSGHFYIEPERSKAIEVSLKNLSYADGGLLLHGLSQIGAGLSEANNLLDQALSEPLCYNSKPNQKAQYLKNVVIKYFVGVVQQDLAELSQRYQQLMPSYLQLEATLADSAPPAYQRWQKGRQQTFKEALNSAKYHVEKIQRVFSICGISIT